MKIIDAMYDQRINCFSIMLKMDSKKYMELIDDAYSKTGDIQGQRKPLTSKTGKRIRATMKDDIKKHTVLPPLVIGCVIMNEEFIAFDKKYKDKNIEKNDMEDIMRNYSLSIIDGMQRTTALREILDDDSDFSNELRVELWVTNSTNNLIYRMLVLNTGQISWNLKKQLEVVFNHVKEEIETKIPITQYI